MNRAGHLWTPSDTPPSLARVVVASGVLAVALCVAGVLYAVLTYINPIVYVGFVITIGFGFVAAYAAIGALFSFIPSPFDRIVGFSFNAAAGFFLVYLYVTGSGMF